MDKWVIAYKNKDSLLPAEYKRIDSQYYWNYEKAKELFEQYKEGLQPFKGGKGWFMPYKFIDEFTFEYNKIIYNLKKL